MRDYLQAKAGQLKHTKNYIRQTMGSEEELRCLARDYSKRPLYPIICGLDWEVVDGNRRLAGVLEEFGPDAEVPICRTDEVVDDATKLEIMLQSAIHTRALQPFEEFLGYTKWLEINRGASAEALAGRIGRTASMMSRILSLRRTILPIREAAEAGLIGPAEWSEYAKCDERQQHEMWSARVAGELNNRDDVARAGRKARGGNGTAVRLNRVKCPLPNATVIVTGDALRLDDAIEACIAATRAMKAAREEGLDAKTAQAVWEKRLKKSAGRNEADACGANS
jgi:hypothetical protein